MKRWTFSPYLCCSSSSSSPHCIPGRSCFKHSSSCCSGWTILILASGRIMGGSFSFSFSFSFFPPISKEGSLLGGTPHFSLKQSRIYPVAFSYVCVCVCVSFRHFGPNVFFLQVGIKDTAWTCAEGKSRKRSSAGPAGREGSSVSPLSSSSSSRPRIVFNGSKDSADREQV